MSDMIDMYRDARFERRALRAMFGVPCPKCAVNRPRAHPSILLPGDVCRVDQYHDRRATLTIAQRDEAVEALAQKEI